MLINLFPHLPVPGRGGAAKGDLASPQLGQRRAWGGLIFSAYDSGLGREGVMACDNREGSTSPLTPTPLVGTGWLGIQMTEVLRGFPGTMGEPLSELCQLRGDQGGSI